ncbi:MAG: hypothetical protein H6881_08320 [Rhodobiaceae bacterium]|nr:hypothetical protein [Rhodobiaceae bacterium]MCC0051868.1 hypothetical protein [Rhodobiaceae bacterium]
MSDFATLVLAADGTKLKSGEKALDSLTASATKAEQKAGKSLKVVQSSMDEVGKASVANSQRTRMMAMQLSQVAQQASATGNWVQALAIQLPDLALGFGTVGIAAGVVAGAVLPLAAEFLNVGDNADKVKDSLDELAASSKSLGSAVDAVRLDIYDLSKEFGTGAGQARELNMALLDLAQIKALNSLRDTAVSLSSQLSDVVEMINSAERGFSAGNTTDMEIAVGIVDELRSRYGLTVEEAIRLRNALNDLSAATGPQDTANAAQELSDILRNARDETGRIPDELRAVAEEATKAGVEGLRLKGYIEQAEELAGKMASIDLASGIGAGADEAGRLADNAAAAAQNLAIALANWDKLSAAERMRVTVNGLLPKPGMGLRPIYSGGGRLLNEQELMNWRAEHTKSQYEIAAEKAAKRGRRGHRGPTKEEQEAQREYNRLLSQAKNIYSETRTEAEAYGIELTKLGDLYARGFIDTETYQRAVKQLKDEFNGAAEASKFFSETAYDSIMSLVPAINTGNKALDDFLNTLIKTVMQAVLLGEGPLAKLFGTEGGGLLTSIFGSIFKSYEGGGYTGLGGRYGGMDGKGGFLAMVHPNETIIDHAKPGILAAANNNARPATNGQPQPVEINVNVSGARGNAEIKEMVNQGVAAGLKQYDAKALPGRVVQVSKNPRVRG